jgi:hypothetical protein
VREGEASVEKRFPGSQLCHSSRRVKVRGLSASPFGFYIFWQSLALLHGLILLNTIADAANSRKVTTTVMSSKPKADAKVTTLKGQEGVHIVAVRSSSAALTLVYPTAEDKVLEYLKRVSQVFVGKGRASLRLVQMNRPFGAVDVSANLKGAVPKTATQKILIALAEKGEVVQKTYGVPLCVYKVVKLARLAVYVGRKDNVLRREPGEP